MSSNAEKAGTLWVVATPLGNPGDLSPRARGCLEAADIVLAEDTRRESLACARWGVRVQRFVSFHDHNEEDRGPEVLEWLRQGKSIALISDAGMPVLADPGYGIVRACREAGLPVSVVPGPCAPVAALAGSGIAPQPFVFFGFLPRGRGDQKKTLEPYAQLSCTLVFFERRDRLAETLAAARALLGPRDACIARELTKTHEEFLRFRLEDPPDLS
ncbi:MAG: 16S rRNA (cytidine(1402)-2'-O)-methyltransferase, partial [Mailhella sp.]|nr:16S rRNA (cytidine(1402)-2'-O)-methyltransferase [Mailhella sp.]